MIETPKGKELSVLLSRCFLMLGEHARTNPGEVDAAVVRHVRSWRPEALALDTSPVAKVEVSP